MDIVGVLRKRLRSPHRAAITAAGTAVFIAVGALLFVWSGIYSLAASRGHFWITEQFLRFALHSSVRTHTLTMQAPPLDDPDMVSLGAGHYAGGCAPCHGAPGTPVNPILHAALPPPPDDLATRLEEWEPEELHWIVLHGIKYTGMPGWASQARGDEVWSVVAFLRAYHRLDEAEYRRLAGFVAAQDTQAKPETPTIFSEALTTCARCHGDADSPPTSALAPRLAGQREAYLAAALRDYARGARYSGIMQPVAAELEEADIVRLSAHYAGLPANLAAGAGEEPDPDLVARGRRIAISGVPESGVPACTACHKRDASAVFPRLEGQFAPYLEAQLRAFRDGVRGETATGAIMQTVAQRLDDAQIEAAAAWFASRSAAAPAAVGEAR